MDDLIRAIAVARLEIDGVYQEDKHDALFGNAGSSADLRTPDLFPDYLVEMEAGQLDSAEYAAVTDGLAAGLPLKVLVQTNDILDPPPFGPTHFGFGQRGRQLANIAIGLSDVYVLQAPGSHLLKLSDRLQSGLQYRGPASSMCSPVRPDTPGSSAVPGRRGRS